jgi:hypothetical protein
MSMASSKNHPVAHDHPADKPCRGRISEWLLWVKPAHQIDALSVSLVPSIAAEVVAAARLSA